MELRTQPFLIILIFNILLFYFISVSSLFISSWHSPKGGAGRGLLLQHLASIHDIDALLSLTKTLTCEVVDGIVKVSVNVKVLN